MGEAFRRLLDDALATGSLLHLQVDLTARCPLDCGHCYLDAHREPGLPFSQLADLLDDARRLGVLQVHFSGGEVLLREDLLPILTLARRLRFLVQLTTSAVGMTEALAGELAALHLHQVAVSLYSPDPAVHDAITRRPGSHAQTLAGVRRLRAHGVRVKLKTLVTTANRDAWQGMPALARQLGAGLLLDPLVLPSAGGKRPLRPALQITPAEMQAGAAAQRAWRQASAAPPGAATASPAGPSVAAICLAGQTGLYVSPVGEVQPCVVWPLVIGDLHRERLPAIWARLGATRPFAGLVRSAMQGCAGCPELPSCGLCPGLQQRLTGDPLGRAAAICQRTAAWAATRAGSAAPADPDAGECLGR